MIVEDSRSGLQFFKKATEDHDLECISSNGKSGIVKLLEQHKGKRILVIADAAALGSEIKVLMYLKSVSNNKIDLFCRRVLNGLFFARRFLTVTIMFKRFWLTQQNI